MSLVWNFQINATAPKHSVTCSQYYETNSTPLFGIVCVYRQQSLDTSNSCYWLQVWRYRDKEPSDVTTVTGTLCKPKEKLNICFKNGSVCESSLKHIDCYNTLPTVLTARRSQ